MGSGDQERPPDIEIGARVRARTLRFEETPETETSFSGDVRSETVSERDNLPDEVEPDVTYRDIDVRWRAGARIEDSDESSGA